MSDIRPNVQTMLTSHICKILPAKLTVSKNDVHSKRLRRMPAIKMTEKKPCFINLWKIFCHKTVVVEGHFYLSDISEYTSEDRYSDASRSLLESVRCAIMKSCSILPVCYLGAYLHMCVCRNPNDNTEIMLGWAINCSKSCNRRSSWINE